MIQRDGWVLTPLGKILSQVSRPVRVDPSVTYRLLGAQWYAKGLFAKAEKIGAEIQANTLFEVKTGDFIYNRLFAWKGSFAVASHEHDGCFVSNEFPCFEADHDRLDPRFLWLYFSRQKAWSEALGLSSGSTPTSRNRLKEEQFLRMSIPLPTLSEQRRIVARIEEFAAKIEEARTLRQRTPAQEVLTAGRRALIGEAPGDDWIPLCTFVAEIENGKSPACEARPANLDEWGILKVGAVSFGVFDERENKALPPDHPYDPCYEVKVGDFLMSRANTTELVGACAIVERTRFRLLLSDKIFRFHFKKGAEVVPAWLNHVMKSPALREQIAKLASGTSPTMKNISKEKVLRLLVPPNSGPEQRRIVARLDALQAAVDELKRLQAQTAAELDALLPSILDRAFKGEP